MGGLRGAGIDRYAGATSVAAACRLWSSKSLSQTALANLQTNVLGTAFTRSSLLIVSLLLTFVLATTDRHGYHHVQPLPLAPAVVCHRHVYQYLYAQVSIAADDEQKVLIVGIP